MSIFNVLSIRTVALVAGAPHVHSAVVTDHCIFGIQEAAAMTKFEGAQFLFEGKPLTDLTKAPEEFDPEPGRLRCRVIRAVLR